MKNSFYSLYLPYFIFLSISFNTIFKNFGISYLYVFLILVGIIGMLLDNIKKNNNINSVFIYFYVIVLLVIYLLQTFLYEDPIRGIKSLLVYIVMLIYWAIYFNKFTIYNFQAIIIKTIPIVYLIALLAFIQYFLSPNLFGFLDDDSSVAIQWASNATFQEYSVYFRASSCLGSPQVFGLFMVLYIIIIANMTNLKNNLNRFGILFLAFAGMLSGNKSFFYILIIYLLFKFFKTDLQSKLIWATTASGIILLFGFVFTDVTKEISIIDRVVNIDQVVNQEKSDSRLERYQNILIEANPIIGNGLGTKTDGENENLKAAESYFLQIFYEAGSFALLFFLLLIFCSYILATQQLFTDVKVLIFLIFISMIIVHAFSGPEFFIFWGVIVSSYYNKKFSRKNLHKYHTVLSFK